MELKLRAGDRLALASDGIELLVDAEIEGLIRLPFEQVTPAVGSFMAHRNQDNQDNVSLLVVELIDHDQPRLKQQGSIANGDPDCVAWARRSDRLVTEAPRVFEDVAAAKFWLFRMPERKSKIQLHASADDLRWKVYVQAGRV